MNMPMDLDRGFGQGDLHFCLPGTDQVPRLLIMVLGDPALGLSLGSAAMAQDGPSGPAQDYQASQILAGRVAQPSLVHSGSSDVSGFHFGAFHATPDRGIATVGGDGGKSTLASLHFEKGPVSLPAFFRCRLSIIIFWAINRI
jgi:hypothetical protein